MMSRLSPVLDVVIGRERAFKNKYEEAAHYAARYPQLTAVQPKPRCLFDREPRSTVLFEAVALAEAVRRNPTSRLAKAMG